MSRPVGASPNVAHPVGGVRRRVVWWWRWVIAFVLLAALTDAARLKTDRTGYFRVALTASAGAATPSGPRVTVTSAGTNTMLRYTGNVSVPCATLPDSGGGTPTDIPAGTGGEAVDTASVQESIRWAALVTGLLLFSGGAVTTVRRRWRQT